MYYKLERLIENLDKNFQFFACILVMIGIKTKSQT